MIKNKRIEYNGIVLGINKYHKSGSTNFLWNETRKQLLEQIGSNKYICPVTLQEYTIASYTDKFAYVNYFEIEKIKYKMNYDNNRLLARSLKKVGRIK